MPERPVYRNQRRHDDGISLTLTRLEALNDAALLVMAGSNESLHLSKIPGWRTDGPRAAAKGLTPVQRIRIATAILKMDGKP